MFTYGVLHDITDFNDFLSKNSILFCSTSLLYFTEHLNIYHNVYFFQINTTKIKYLIIHKKPFRSILTSNSFLGS